MICKVLRPWGHRQRQASPPVPTVASMVPPGCTPIPHQPPPVQAMWIVSLLCTVLPAAAEARLAHTPLPSHSVHTIAAVAGLLGALFLLKAHLVHVHMRSVYLHLRYTAAASLVAAGCGLLLCGTAAALLHVLERVPNRGARVVNVVLALVCLVIAMTSSHGLSGYLYHCMGAASAGRRSWRFYQPFQVRPNTTSHELVQEASQTFVSRLHTLNTRHTLCPFAVAAPAPQAQRLIHTRFYCILCMRSTLQQSPHWLCLQGGKPFMATQGLGWTVFAVVMLGLLHLLHRAACGLSHMSSWPLVAGAMLAQVAIAASVHVFAVPVQKKRRAADAVPRVSGTSAAPVLDRESILSGGRPSLAAMFHRCEPASVAGPCRHSVSRYAMCIVFGALSGHAACNLMYPRVVANRGVLVTQVKITGLVFQKGVGVGAKTAEPASLLKAGDLRPTRWGCHAGRCPWDASSCQRTCGHWRLALCSPRSLLPRLSPSSSSCIRPISCSPIVAALL